MSYGIYNKLFENLKRIFKKNHTHVGFRLLHAGFHLGIILLHDTSTIGHAFCFFSQFYDVDKIKAYTVAHY